MGKIENLFKAEASSPLELTMLNGGSVGFVIPEYQREYDWSEGNIKRLYCDTLNGFQRLSTSKGANTFTFLGTLILVEKTSTERGFSGESYAIVDGQQRLTSLALFACALCEALRREFHQADFTGIDKKILEWLKNEMELRQLDLHACAVGSQKITPSESFLFPKIVRHVDTRGRDVGSSEYRSPIGKFLEGFSKYFESKKIKYDPLELGRGGAPADKLEQNFYKIRDYVNNLNNSTWYEDTECEMFDIRDVHIKECRKLFERLPVFMDNQQDEINKAIHFLCNNEAIHDFVRTLIFCVYFCKYIVLTRVTTEDESVAFDIFDALNTTGQPLTALQTLKPRVINFEKQYQKQHPRKHVSYTYENAFADIDECIDQRFSDTQKKQSETKELIVSFALYIEGKKISNDLATQRNFLRRSYGDAVNEGFDAAHKFINSLACVAKFRRHYWERDGIEQLNNFHGADTVDQIKLFISFIHDMKTSLILPILVRYWDPNFRNTAKDVEFLQVLRAVTSFLVLRRAATSGTAGIDTDFRGIMAPKTGRGAIRKFGLCAGVDHSRKILKIDELKNSLKDLLKYKLKSLDREDWVRKVIPNPLYGNSAHLVRFMILAAADQSMPSETNLGTWERDNLRESMDERDFLSYTRWQDERYRTVEHIAPDTASNRGWPTELYDDPFLRHSLGNLILLPSRENSAIGNSDWVKKEIFYRALTAITQDAKEQRIAEARAVGYNFSQQLIDHLDNRGRLSLLDPLSNVEKWNKDIVYRRSKNIAELCWDVVWPWLN